MARRSYPCFGNRARRVREKWQGVTNCTDCKKHIAIQDPYVAIDIQLNWMRGDDEVATLCTVCSEKTQDIYTLLRKCQKQNPD